MKPQWMVFCGKVAVSDQFTASLHISTLDILPTGPLHPFLVLQLITVEKIILLSFCGQSLNQKSVFMLPFRAGVFLSHSWFQVIISPAVIIETKEEIGRGETVGGGEEGKALL